MCLVVLDNIVADDVQGHLDDESMSTLRGVAMTTVLAAITFQMVLKNNGQQRSNHYKVRKTSIFSKKYVSYVE